MTAFTDIALTFDSFGSHDVMDRAAAAAIIKNIIFFISVTISN